MIIIIIRTTTTPGFKNGFMRTKLLGLQWQGAPSKDVPGEYRVRFPGGTTLGQCACLYARAGLVAHLWWVGTGAKAKKKNGFMSYNVCK
ncbi:cytochrome P450 93A3 [Trifolium repens]|nr:cytochrome P450 93A3 [Trifolium repens]